MEDRHVLLQGFNGSDNCHLFAVFDGHRGGDTAEYASRCGLPQGCCLLLLCVHAVPCV